MVFIIGFLAALMAFVLVGRDQLPFEREKRRIGDLYSLESTRSMSELPAGSLEYRLLAAGVPLQPLTFRLLSAAAGLAAGVIAWAFLPGLPALAAAGLVFYIPSGWLEDKVKSRGREIDKLLPLAVGRITAGLLAGGSVQDVL